MISGKNVVGGVAGGATAGAAIGSFIPVIGNAVGAVIEATFGGISVPQEKWYPSLSRWHRSMGRFSIRRPLS